MRLKKVPTIAILIVVCLLLIVGSSLNIFSVLSGFGKTISLPIVVSVFRTGQSIFAQNKDTSIVLENKKLRTQLVVMDKLAQDNKALRDQFATSMVHPSHLVPAQIVGAPTFIPGVTTIETLILDKGTSDGLQVGQAVIYKDNLIGKIIKTSSSLAKVQTVSANGSSFTAETSNGLGSGVIKGQGLGHMLLDNVTLSEKIQKGDTIVTKGAINEKGQGFPPHLLVGKITDINKKPSALFQSADVISLVNFAELNTVFVLIHYE